MSQVNTSNLQILKPKVLCSGIFFLLASTILIPFPQLVGGECFNLELP